MIQNVSFFSNLQVVQEYERAVIFRLGRLLSGGAKGPGKINTITLIHLFQREYNLFNYYHTANGHFPTRDTNDAV